MLLNYLKLSLRLLVRNPFFTLVNVLGLSAGFAAFFILWQYTQYQLHTDQFQKDSKNIVRFRFDARFAEKENEWSEKSFGTNNVEVAKRIASDFEEIESSTRIINQENFRVGIIPFHREQLVISLINQNNEKVGFNETKLAYADPNVFQFFDLPLLKGAVQSILSQPYSIALSESTAKKYFGSTDCMGKTLELNDTVSLTVTGVFKDLPHNTHLDFELVISTETIRQSLMVVDYKTLGGHCYFKLREGTNRLALQEKIQALKIKYWGELFGKLNYVCCTHTDVRLVLQPLADIPYSNYWTDYFIPRSRDTLMLFAVVSLIILLLAFINYVNLTISLNHQRLKEFAARKTLGARPRDLIIQFMVEAGVINVMAILLALTLIQLVRYPLEVLFAFYFPDWKDTSLMTVLIMMSAIVSGLLITGFYPALITMKRTPKSLFGAFKTRLNKDFVSRWLTTVQYVSATVLIIWTFVIYSQLNFMLTRELGIDKENVLVVDLPPDAKYNSDLTSLTHKLDQQNGVLDYAVSRSVPADEVLEAYLSDVGTGEGNGKGGGHSNGGVDERFIPFYKIKLLAGRNFFRDKPSDHNSIIVDMGAIKFTGIDKPAAALGMKIWIQDAYPYQVWRSVEVIGVMESYRLVPSLKKFNSQSGTLLTYKQLRKSDRPRRISMRINPAAFEETLAAVGDSFHQFYPRTGFSWYFLDDYINRHYVREKQERNQIVLMASIAIGIACLGLLGMVANQVTSKTKELGIRKVLGASLGELGGVLMKNTSRLMLVAIVISVPISSFLLREHLSHFSERITPQWWHYVVPIAVLLAIMFASIATVLYKAVKTNPVEALRYE